MLYREWLMFRDRVTWSWQGWVAAWRTERNLRQWFFANLASVVMALLLDLDPAERAVVISLGLLLLVVEIINTAIERTVDLLTKEPHPLAKEAKDMGSAAVALMAVAAGLAWIVVLFG